MFLFEMLTNFSAACQAKGIKFIPTWYKYLDSSTVSGKCTPKIVFPDDLDKIALAIAEIMLRVGAIIAVAFVIYGGFQYILSQGEPDKIANARKTIINAIVGLAISMTA